MGYTAAADVASLMAVRWSAILAVLVFAAASARGWWMYFSVDPAHDAGLELGLAGAMLAAIALFVAIITGRPPGD